jgi:hypothetical protein
METLLTGPADLVQFPKTTLGEALAEGGFLHLLSLTPEAQHWGHLRIEGAGARF